MLRNRLAAIVFGTALATAGGAAAAAHALAGGEGDDNPPASSPAAPFTVEQDVAGVGHVSFVLDPATGAISNVVVTPLPGVTVGTPVVHDGKVEVPVILADGTKQTLTVEAEEENGGFQAKVEVDEQEQDAEEEGPEAENPEADNHNGPHNERGQQPETGHGHANAGSDSRHENPELSTSAPSRDSDPHEGTGGDHDTGGHDGEGDGHHGEHGGD